MVGRNLSVSANRRGGLMVRCDPDQSDALLDKPYVEQIEMRGRPMAGWLYVAADGVRTKRQLAPWVARGVGYARSLAPKR
ncbi:MAG TPA: RNA methyltransferase [Solirubrobacteraceae bacterium]|nr:RNA methyltransferase [Solirubrobacteraceae bacterium]